MCGNLLSFLRTSVLVCLCSGLMWISPSLCKIKDLSIVVSILFPLASHQISQWAGSGSIYCLIKQPVPCQFGTKWFHKQSHNVCPSKRPYGSNDTLWAIYAPGLEFFFFFLLCLFHSSSCILLSLSFHLIMLLHHIHYNSKWYVIIAKCNRVKSSAILLIIWPLFCLSLSPSVI